ncbi:MAG: GNAT family N-acetyltransferase [Actinomycetota bacterium]|nr:GNAT family N-acetyltransferase [Actinomycetota bacterium]
MSRDQELPLFLLQGVVVSSRVRLRLMGEDELSVVAAFWSAAEVAGDFEWHGFRPAQQLRRRFEEDGLLSEDRGRLAIDIDGACVGVVSWHRVRHGPNTASWCWNIGVMLLPEHRGQGVGTEAHRLVADYLFETTPVKRLEAGTDVDNVAEQKALEKNGFVREGVLRAAQFRAGDWRDIALYSLLRNEWASQR